jgi:hypothetical protein
MVLGTVFGLLRGAGEFGDELSFRVLALRQQFERLVAQLLMASVHRAI